MRLLQKLIVAVLVIVILGSLSYKFVLPNFPELESQVNNILGDFAVINKQDTEYKELSSENEEKFYYQQLRSDEKDFYLWTLYNTKKFQYVIDVNRYESISADRANVIFNLMLLDHPEIFWMSGESFCRFFEGNDKQFITSFEMMEYLSQSDVESFQKDINDITKKILSETKQLTSDYEKVLYVYDYLIDSCDYDYESVELRVNDEQDTYSYLSGQILSSLITKKPVCSGYAKGFAYLLSEMGVEAICVIGEAGESHEWNIVKMDGDYYQMDVTWGDPEVGKENEMVSYLYFGLTDEEMSDHIPQDGFDYPECVNSDCNYFVKENLCFEIYDFNKISDLIKAKIEAGEDEVIFKFKNYLDLEICIQNLMSNGQIFDITDGYSNIQQELIHYFYYKDYNLIKISF